MPKWTWAPDNRWAFVQPESAAISFDLERGLLSLITAAGETFGQISTDTLVAASFSPQERRFGSVPSDEAVSPPSGARRWGAVPSDEQVPNDFT